MKKIIILLVICLAFSQTYAFNWRVFEFDSDNRADIQARQRGNRHSQSFYAVKQEMLEKIYYDHRRTLYCGAEFTRYKQIIKPQGFKLPNVKKADFQVYEITAEELARKAERMEWEHIVPANNFGKTFKEWSFGHNNCVSRKGKKFKGRRCAEQESEEFRYMYADMYNLYPSIGAVNYLRSNFNFTQFDSRLPNTFGTCALKISKNKAEPVDDVKGLIARTYLYMQQTYPRYSIGEPMYGILLAWAKKYPVTAWECRRAYRIEKAQGNANNIVKKDCVAQNMYHN